MTKKTKMKKITSIPFPGFFAILLISSAAVFSLAFFSVRVAGEAEAAPQIVKDGGQKIPGTAPVKPEFERYINLKKRGRLQAAAPEEHALGLVPSPFQPGSAPEGSSPRGMQVYRESFPASYNLRTLGKVSSVKNQGSCGSCWAFATMGSLESDWLVSGESASNLSENNLKECHGFEWTACDGGNSDISSAYLSQNQGPISEADDPYFDTEESCHSGFYPVAYVPDARYLPDDSDVIKQYLTDYGALYTAFYWQSASYNSGNYTYYYSGAEDGNHAVTLVGWDDNKVTAGGTGAWILKNSWGADWGDSGYFYISYNDTKVNEDVAVWPSKIDYTNAKTIYMYDEMGMINAYGWSDETDYGLTKFVASGNQQITKVGTWITSDGATAGFEIYDDFNGTTLSSLLGSLPGQSADYAGYYTFDLASPIAISNGDDFYVKVTYNTPGYSYPIPIEMVYPGYADPAIETGKNWMSDDASGWDAVGEGTSDPYDLGIRAYALSTETVAAPSASPAGGTYTTIQSVTLSTATGGASIYYTTDGSTPTTSSNLYNGAIEISADTTLKAFAVKAGVSDSAVMSETYVVNLLQTSTPSASPAGGTFSSAQAVTLSSATSGASIHYTTDGSTPTTSSTHYTGAISISQNTTLKAIAVKYGLDNSAVMSETYFVQASVPSASPAGGTYTTIQSVTLSTATGGASIYYTTDGSTPTTSSNLYNGAIEISADTTLKAFAVKAGVSDSAVMSETYAIQVITDTPTLGYSTSKKATKYITFKFNNLTLTKKKWVTIRLNGKRVAVSRVTRSGNDSLVRVKLKFKKWAARSYNLSMSYKNQIRIPYTTKKGKTKYRKGWESGSVTSENILSII